MQQTMITIRTGMECQSLSHGFNQKERYNFEKLIKQLSKFDLHEVSYIDGIEISVKCCDAMNDEAIKRDVIEACQQALERVDRWHRKADLVSGISLLVIYVLGVMFFSEAYEQTQGIVSFVILVAAFALLFIPWWFHHLKDFIEENLIGEP